jgi:hypothetical protein
MSIDLTSLYTIPSAVSAYLRNLVKVEMSDITPDGITFDAGESFTFTVTARNYAAEAQGVAVQRVCYHLVVDDPTIAKLIVPPATQGTATRHGTVLVPGEEATEMIFNPSDAGVKGDFKLGVGEAHTVQFMGKLGSNASGKTVKIHARVLAEVDLDRFFPNGQTPYQSRSIMVAPD